MWEGKGKTTRAGLARQNAVTRKSCTTSRLAAQHLVLAAQTIVNQAPKHASRFLCYNATSAACAPSTLSWYLCASSCLDGWCGPVARHASTTLQDDDTSFSMGPGCTSNHSRQFLKLLEGRPSPTLIPFEPNPHGHGVLLPDLGWPLERMVTGRDFVLLRGHCELQACSVLRWLHARPVHQQNVKPQHFPLANLLELTCEPVHQLHVSSKASRRA